MQLGNYLNLTQTTTKELANYCSVKESEVIRWVTGHTQVPLRNAIQIVELSFHQVTYRDLYKPYAMRYSRPIMKISSKLL